MRSPEIPCRLCSAAQSRSCSGYCESSKAAACPSRLCAPSIRAAIFLLSMCSTRAVPRDTRSSAGPITGALPASRSWPSVTTIMTWKCLPSPATPLSWGMRRRSCAPAAGRLLARTPRAEYPRPLSTCSMGRRLNRSSLTRFADQRSVSACDQSKEMIRRNPLATDGAVRIAAKAAAFLCAVAVVLLARPATATELAILRNGFSIRHEHRLVMGATTRLYLGADDSSFTDVPTDEITGYEKDLSSPLPLPSPLPAAADAHASVSVPFGSAKPESAKAESAKSWSASSWSAKSGSAKFVPAPGLNQVVNSASAAYHLDPDLVHSVIHADSGFNSRAVSPKGARGLMQLMPGTANQLGVNDAFDPQANRKSTRL